MRIERLCYIITCLCMLRLLGRGISGGTAQCLCSHAVMDNIKNSIHASTLVLHGLWISEWTFCILSVVILILSLSSVLCSPGSSRSTPPGLMSSKLTQPPRRTGFLPASRLSQSPIFMTAHVTATALSVWMDPRYVCAYRKEMLGHI